MSTHIEIILSRGSDVVRAAQARDRLLWAWGLQWVVLLGMIVCAVVGGLGGVIVILGVLVLMLMAWAATEVWTVQTALREPIEVRVRAFLGVLVPITSQILVPVLLLDTAVVSTLARRLRQNQCAVCGYDLRGLPDAICPECGRRNAA